MTRIFKEEKKMLSFGKNKRIANLIIDDYVIRLVDNNGQDLQSIKRIEEKSLPVGMIENGRIVDEIEFYNFMKQLVADWGLKKREIRFYVPHSLIIMRDIELPQDVKFDEAKDYIQLETGNTIHFPFKDPVFDVYGQPKENNRVTVLAAPQEEMIKYIDAFVDSSLKPVAVDVQPLGVYRYFYEERNGLINETSNYLFVDLNLTYVNYSIFSENTLEFIRHQTYTLPKSDWQGVGESPIQWDFVGDKDRFNSEIEDQLSEIDRLMSFYQFSLHKGNKTITDIVVYGDLPSVDKIAETLGQRHDIPIHVLKSTENGPKRMDIPNAFVPALGLALKGGK